MLFNYVAREVSQRNNASRGLPFSLPPVFWVYGETSLVGKTATAPARTVEPPDHTLAKGLRISRVPQNWIIEKAGEGAIFFRAISFCSLPFHPAFSTSGYIKKKKKHPALCPASLAPLGPLAHFSSPAPAREQRHQLFSWQTSSLTTRQHRHTPHARAHLHRSFATNSSPAYTSRHPQAHNMGLTISSRYVQTDGSGSLVEAPRGVSYRASHVAWLDGVWVLQHIKAVRTIGRRRGDSAPPDFNKKKISSSCVGGASPARACASLGIPVGRYRWSYRPFSRQSW